MKKLLYFLLSVVLLISISSCTAEELPETTKTLQGDAGDSNNSGAGETDPPTVIPPKK
ncbi:hypothetical protein FLAN108750_09530 [Flavobacterium antarcticum]|uniref:hypothetical protein n=1 Tax=Flavobacterium antarcticum TaxID=271155 RepID=UPI0003B61EA4|nr:hypothetical protein [Flavobacterium antarcticum]